MLCLHEAHGNIDNPGDIQHTLECTFSQRDNNDGCT